MRALAGWQIAAAFTLVCEAAAELDCGEGMVGSVYVVEGRLGGKFEFCILRFAMFLIFMAHFFWIDF